MAVLVCDAIMGAGKTSAAITYMNEHSNDLFVYITPFLDEANRIRLSCPDLHFVEPSNKLGQFDFSKTVHTFDLLKNRRNIATTHKAFKYYTPEMMQEIREGGYTLLIDENVSVLESTNITRADIDMLCECGFVESDGNDGNEYKLGDRVYEGSAFGEFIRTMRLRKMMRVIDDDDDMLYYWMLSPEFITAFKDVIVMTYLFDGQDIHHFLELNRVPYTKIGTKLCDDGRYRFHEGAYAPPAYTGRLSEMIHIYEGEKLNEIGDNTFALSMNWFEKKSGVEKLKNNVYNYFRNIIGDDMSSGRMWGTYDKFRTALRGKGYTNQFVIFNDRATNAYRERNVLVYAVNLYMNVGQKLFYRSRGIEVSDDAYALSIMVQWVWRSAIRDGKEIWIYVPSRRMRELLIDWIASVERSYREWDGNTEVVA